MASFKDRTKPFIPALAIEHTLNRPKLSALRWTTGVITGVSTSIGIVGTLTGNPLVDHPYLWYGSALLAGGLWLEQVMLYSYHNYYYFAGLQSRLQQPELPFAPIHYAAAAIISHAPDDLTASFLQHPLGVQITSRAGLTEEAIAQFLKQPRTPIDSARIPAPDNETLTLTTLGTTILNYDPAFVTLMEQQGVRSIHFLGALRWVDQLDRIQKIRARWWSKGNLLNGQGLGNSWAYGYTATLNRVLRPVYTSAVFSVFGSIPQYAEAKVDEISEQLLHEKAGNALVLGEAGVGKADVVMALEQRIDQGQSVAGLQHKRIAILDMERVLATTDKPQQLEQLLQQVFAEAAEAGNIILVIEHLSDILVKAQERGANLATILDPYLAHPELQFIVTDTPHGFHTHLQPKGVILRRFGQVVIDVPDTETVVRILQRSCTETERRHNVFFTYPALIAIAQGAHRYITDGVAPDSALTLLVEVAAAAHQKNRRTITAETVHAHITESTGIPMGKISTEERDVLLHLEDRLHARVIGQTTAIDAIADTIRRARVGIQNSNRPLGSFLFLGPTGVGKTETAKTLAEVFFGDAEHMVRLDMSEYNHDQALTQLIGDQSNSGSLSQALHDHPYTVLLLDEFEKANTVIHDLFLQILDEGVFTNGRGDQVNARNTIIIATSNAGSDLIYRTTEQRVADQALNTEIVEHIIKTGLFRPELINRFDNAIIFEPLKQDEQAKVASLMLAELVGRVEQQGYHLELAPDVTDYLRTHGYSATFGARAMRREIQDHIEAAIAEKIIREQPQPGTTLTLQAADLA